MPTPEFILDLRTQIGHAPLVLVGITAVVLHEGKVLLGRRSDNAHLTPITGIVDPGEEPAIAAVREIAEEAGIVAVARGLVWVHQLPRLTHMNGDMADYLDLVFVCDYVSGEPVPVDGEMTEVLWRDVSELDDVPEWHQKRIRLALEFTGATRFES